MSYCKLITGLCLGENAVREEWLIWDLGLVMRVNSEKPQIWIIVSLKLP